MSCKERPPRVYSDKKGSYIINGDRKMRITPLNKNKNINTNQNVVNVILKECRTKQKRRRMTKPKPKQPIPMKPLEQQVNDANYRLYHIIQDRKREAQEQLRALIQKVQEKSIGIPSTDNSLMAIAREMKTSPSELEAKILPSVSEQILGAQVSERDDGGPRRVAPNAGALNPASTPPSVLDSGSKTIAGFPDETKNADVIMEEPSAQVSGRDVGGPRRASAGAPSIPEEEEEEEEEEDEKEEEPPQGTKEEVPAPIPQYTDQLISNVKDLEANLPSDSESSESSVDELKQQIEQPNEETLRQARVEASAFLKSKPIFNAQSIKELVDDYNVGWTNMMKGIVDLPNNPLFISDFIEFNKDKPPKRMKGATGVKGVKVHYKLVFDRMKQKNAIRNANRASQGNGKRSLMTGLYNDQIDDMLRHEPKYFGCISRDEIHKLQLDDNGCYGFVYNTVPSNKPTIYDGHWRAIYIDLDDGKSIDHYDSFGEPAEEDIQNQIGTLLKPFNLPYYLKWKDNKIVNQRSNSSNCGFFCVNFLQDRFEGIPFVDSTGYSNANKAEKDLKKKFGYLV